MFVKKIMKNFFLGLLILLGLVSCDDSRNEYLAGTSWASADSRIKLIDTLTLKMSTIIMDSVATSGQSKILIGRTKDQTFGEIKSSSIFEITPSSYTITSKNTAVFDSINLYLTYNDYYYGDTLKTFKLSVSPLEKRLKLNADGNLYNTSKFNNSNSIGEISFLPRPNKKNNYLKINLDKSYGQALFNLFKTGNVNSQEYFLNFYKGLALIPSNDNEAFLNFGIGTTLDLEPEDISTVMRMYYHTKNDNGTDVIKYTLDFNINTAYQYNKIDYDFSNSELKNLSPKTPLPSESLDNKAYQFSALGIYTKVEVPYINNILNLYPNITILDANMNVKPIYGTFDKRFYLPENLKYYLADKTNNILSAFTSSDGNEVSITLSTNNEFLDNSQYTFSIANYLKNILSKTTSTNGYSILLYPTNYKDQQIKRLVIGDSRNKINKSNIKLYLLGY
jgi:hypothetical protein